MWKKGFIIGAIPVIILGHVNAFLMTDGWLFVCLFVYIFFAGSEHNPPEFVPYDHLRIRSKVILETILM